MKNAMMGVVRELMDECYTYPPDEDAKMEFLIKLANKDNIHDYEN